MSAQESRSDAENGATPSVPRPAPVVTELSQGFWDAVARGELAVQRCAACGLLRHYPQPLCPACHARAGHPVRQSRTVRTANATR